MPFIPKRHYDELIRAGSAMSNLCFHGSLKCTFPKIYRHSLECSCKKWDAALRAIRCPKDEDVKKGMR